MERARHQALARSVLARDQHVRVRGSDPRNQFQHRPHPRRFRDDIRRVAAQQLIRCLEPPAFAQRARQLDLRAHNREQPLVVPRLRNKIARAALHRFDREIDRCPRRHHHDRQRIVERLNSWNHFESFLTRSRVAGVIEIHDQERVIPLLQRLKNPRERSHRVGLMPFALEQNAQRLQHIILVVRDQDPAHQLTDEPRFPRAVNQSALHPSRRIRLKTPNYGGFPVGDIDVPFLSLALRRTQTALSRPRNVKRREVASVLIPINSTPEKIFSTSSNSIECPKRSKQTRPIKLSVPIFETVLDSQSFGIGIVGSAEKLMTWPAMESKSELPTLTAHKASNSRSCWYVIFLKSGTHAATAYRLARDLHRAIQSTNECSCSALFLTAGTIAPAPASTPSTNNRNVTSSRLANAAISARVSSTQAISFSG